MKLFALDSSVSDETFLNALLEPLVTAGRVKGRGGINFHLDKSRTSQVMNGRCDVPAVLRKALARYGIADAVANEFAGFVDEYLDAGLLLPLRDAILALEEGSDGARLGVLEDSGDINRLMAAALLEAVKNDNRESSEERLWDSGTGSLSVEVGDLLSHGFGKPRKTKQIIVIPVDTTFETRVTWEYENEANPLISPKSLHGKWLTRMSQAGVSPEELDDRIESSLRRRGIEPSGPEGDPPSAHAEYPIGTVAVVENARSLFYLLAISRLDDRSNARSTQEEIAQSVRALLSTYDAAGQGLDIFIPLMGTGSSRANLTHQQSLDLILALAAESKELIHGKVTVVVFRDDAEKLVVPQRRAS